MKVVLQHLSGSLAGQITDSAKAVIKIGRSPDNDIRFNPQQDIKVSSHHCEIRYDGNEWVLVDQGSTNGTLVNGRPVQEHNLSDGDIITFGGQGGPEARFSLDEGMAAAPQAYAQAPMHAGPTPATSSARPSAPRKASGRDATAVAAEAAAKARAAREAGGGVPGQTMFYMAQAIEEVVEDKKSGFRRVLVGVLLLFVVVVGAMGSYIFYQRRQIAGMTQKKTGIDKQIRDLQTQIELAPEDQKADLVATLELLTGQAQQLNTQLEQKGVSEEKRGESGDFIDQQLSAILKKFEADAYRVPPNFKQRVQHYVEEWRSKPDFLRQVYTRKKNYWPAIAQAFAKFGLPEEMAYVGWVESYFDPFACSTVKARGMWQFMTYTGRRYGLVVDNGFDQTCDAKGRDDRTDVSKAAAAAADYLSDLLCDFGSDSFMLAIASYNKGEAGMRQILRQHKLWRKKDRDFWHVYYLKLLPEETLEYVPRIIAAAIVGSNPDKFGLN